MNNANTYTFKYKYNVPRALRLLLALKMISRALLSLLLSIEDISTMRQSIWVNSDRCPHSAHNKQSSRSKCKMCRGSGVLASRVIDRSWLKWTVTTNEMNGCIRYIISDKDIVLLIAMHTNTNPENKFQKRQSAIFQW